MEKRIEEFLEKLSKANRKRFDLLSLEKYLINAYGGQGEYLKHGGYQELYRLISKFNKKNIREIKASKYNGLNPPLKLRWERISEIQPIKWDKSKILQYSDHLDFTYYIKRPELQNETEWEYIENIYSFLKERDKRQWASLEERSLELFYDEKYFSTGQQSKTKGNYGILKRLGLSYEDLKMKKYGEMFIYWNRGVKEIGKIIIVENHSTFFTYKRLLMKNERIFGFKPDILIYGEGKKIENSLGFLEEITCANDVEVLYFGDIDSEGFGIYARLKERYPYINIKLQHDAYIHLIDLCKKDYPLGRQEKNPLYLDKFIEEMKAYLDSDGTKKLNYIWDKDLRIPQELINYEYLLVVKG